jgi:CobQ-like glutamine amidotransferase family enzyme
MSVLRVAVVYPDLLGTYGDTGNGIVLAERACARGMAVDLLMCPSSDSLPEADLYCLGGGEDGPQVLAAERLLADGGLGAAVEGGATVFAVCAGFQIVGRSFPDASGAVHEGLGLLDVTTTKGSGPRCVGEVAVEPDPSLGLARLSGFENHSGVSTLGPEARSLGMVLAGRGNGAGEPMEGAFAGHVLGTYLHGPVLARNPDLADLLLRWASGLRQLMALDDAAELSLRSERLGSVGC